MPLREQMATSLAFAVLSSGAVHASGQMLNF
jgi:hypothetical protein